MTANPDQSVGGVSTYNLFEEFETESKRNTNSVLSVSAGSNAALNTELRKYGSSKSVDVYPNNEREFPRR